MQLEGSIYAQILAQQRSLQERDIASRWFAFETSLSAFASRPVQGIGWGRFVGYSATRGDFGNLPTHNEYLRVLAELGALGALLLLLVGIAIGRAAWNGPRDELGLAIVAMLTTGTVALVFINGLVKPFVMMPLVFAAALACARAGAQAPAVAREAEPWSLGFLGARARATRRRSVARSWVSLRAWADWGRVRRALERAAPQPLALPEVRLPAIRRFAPNVRELPELAMPDLGRTAPPTRELPAVVLPDLGRTAPPAREPPAVRLPLGRVARLAPANRPLRPAPRARADAPPSRPVAGAHRAGARARRLPARAGRGARDRRVGRGRLPRHGEGAGRLPRRRRVLRALAAT